MKVHIKSSLQSNFEVNQILKKLNTEFDIKGKELDELEDAIRNTNGSYVEEKYLTILKSLFDDEWWAKVLDTEKEAKIWYDSLTDRQKEYVNSLSVSFGPSA